MKEKEYCNNCQEYIIQKEFDGEFGCPICERTDCIEIHKIEKGETKMKEYQVEVDYPSECVSVEAETKEEAENKALKQLGEVTFNSETECTAEAFEVEDDKN